MNNILKIQDYKEPLINYDLYILDKFSIDFLKSLYAF